MQTATLVCQMILDKLMELILDELTDTEQAASCEVQLGTQKKISCRDAHGSVNRSCHWIMGDELTSEHWLVLCIISSSTSCSVSVGCSSLQSKNELICFA